MSLPSIESDADPKTGLSDPGDEMVSVSRSELEELRALVRSPGPLAVVDAPVIEAASGREEELTQELKVRDRRVADLESAYRKALRDRELATALAGKPLVSGAVSQLITLWRDDFDVYEESGEYKVASRDGRTVAQWVGERLEGIDFAHFRLPASRGGAGSRGLSQSGVSIGNDVGPRTLGEAVVSQWRESTPARVGAPQGPSGWGRRR